LFYAFKIHIIDCFNKGLSFFPYFAKNFESLIHPPLEHDLKSFSIVIRACILLMFLSMVENILPFTEGDSINRPPMFSGVNYQFWKVGRKIFIESIDR